VVSTANFLSCASHAVSKFAALGWSGADHLRLAFGQLAHLSTFRNGHLLGNT